MNKILEVVNTTNLSVSEIAKFLEVDKQVIIDALIEAGYFMFKDNPNHRLPSAKRLFEAAQYFIEHTEALTPVAKKFKLRKSSLQEYLTKWYPEKPLHRLSYDDHVFDCIDTEEKAYWLGFLYADGYICADPLEGGSHYKMELTLAQADKEHLRKFALFMSYTGEISAKKINRNSKEFTAARIAINSKHLWNTLNNYGCTPRKSLTLQFPDKSIFKSKDLIRHFIRGYFDGDGSLGIYSVKESVSCYKHNKPQTSVAGTPEFLGMVYKIYSNSKKGSFYSTSKDTHNKTWILEFSCKEAFKFANYLYKDSTIFLDRKYLKYMEFCRIFEKSDILLQTNIGEGCDVNTEITTETKESVAS